MNRDGQFTCVRVGQLRWLVRTDLPISTLAEVLRDPEAHLSIRTLQFKNTRTVTVARVPGVAAGLVLRRLNYGQQRHQWRDLFRPSRARRALRYGLLLERAGVATPRALAAAERRRLRWPLAAYLITEEIAGASTLAQFLTRHPHPPRLVLERLADLIARLHGQGFSHRDLKPGNVLLDAQLQPYLIDLDGIRRFRKISEARAAADLARLAAGVESHFKNFPALASRFLKRYCQQRDVGQSCRRLYGEIGAGMRS